MDFLEIILWNGPTLHLKPAEVNHKAAFTFANFEKYLS